MSTLYVDAEFLTKAARQRGVFQEPRRMGGGRKTQTVTVNERFTPSFSTVNSSIPAKNLCKCDLGGVILGCTHATMPECLSKKLFGLPLAHICYVKNIEPGLPLFLFNYSDRKLHGIYEAASYGQMNIDPYAWTDGGKERTRFPAQVCICIKTPCNPITENQFRDIIKDNYYNPRHFAFELDHAQTRGLTALFKPLPVKPKLVPVQPCLSIKSSVAPVASNWADIFKAGPSTSLNTTGDQEHENSEALESKGPELSSYLANEEVSDWEDIAKGTLSGGDPHFNGDYQTMQKIESGDVVLEMDIERILHKLKKLSASYGISNSSS